jgi:hypothetical protein
MRFLVVILVAASCVSCVRAPAPLPRPGVPEANACDALSSGSLLISGLESADGYDDELAALDLDALPAALPLDVTGLQRDVALYMLELDSFDDDAPATIDRDAALSTHLGTAVVGAYAHGDGALDFAFLRRGLHRFYACERGLPLTLAAFNERVVDVASIPEGETVDSDVKGLPRRMRRSAVDGVFVAETLLDRESGAVRETEIIWTDQRRDGALEFLEYDANGNLRSASSFATSTGGDSVGAVPFTCMACHGTHDVTPPE